MSQPFKQWIVLPQGMLCEIDENILTVVGPLHLPLADLPRRMTIARLKDERLVVFSAIPLDENEMASLEEFGRPAFLIVPNDIHRLDARTWKDRYPAMQVVTPEGSRARVEEVVPVDSVTPKFDDPNVTFITVPGTRRHEAALLIHTRSGTTLVLDDLAGNIRGEAGFSGWLLRMAGFAGNEAQIPPVVKTAMVEDKDALRAQLLQWADIPSLQRILVSHGSMIGEDPQQTLRELATSLN